MEHSVALAVKRKKLLRKKEKRKKRTRYTAQHTHAQHQHVTMIAIATLVKTVIVSDPDAVAAKKKKKYTIHRTTHARPTPTHNKDRNRNIGQNGHRVRSGRRGCGGGFTFEALCGSGWHRTIPLKGGKRGGCGNADNLNSPTLSRALEGDGVRIGVAVGVDAVGNKVGDDGARVS